MSLIERDDHENRSQEVGVSSSREFDLKLKMYQNAYHHITGKTEKISFKSSADLIIDFNELAQVHHKISQICDTYRIIARSESVTLFHYKERKEEFTSFERFRIYNKGLTSPTLTAVLIYNFAILPHDSDTPQNYKITIRLNSRVALMKQIIEDAPPLMRGRIYGFMYGSTADISVEYSDYVVARGFVDAVQEWIDGCSKSKSKLNVLKRFQKVSHHLPGAVSFGMGILVTFFS